MHTATIELVLYRAWEPQQLSPHALEPSASPKEKLPQWEAQAPQLESGPCLLQLEKSPYSSEHSAQPKIEGSGGEGGGRGDWDGEYM